MKITPEALPITVNKQLKLLNLPSPIVMNKQAKLTQGEAENGPYTFPDKQPILVQDY